MATQPVDFRKQHDGLAAIVANELRLDPYSAIVVVFRCKRADRVKVLWWDGTGLVLAHKRLEHLKQSGKLFMDETHAPVLDPGRGRTKTSWLWALAREDRNWGGADPPGVVCFYTPGRGGHHGERFLDGFEGILQVDGYAGYNRLAGPRGRVQLAFYWSHARRKLRESFDSTKSEIAAEGLRRIAEFYAIEAEIRGASPERRLAERQAPTAPLVEELIRATYTRLRTDGDTPTD